MVDNKTAGGRRLSIALFLAGALLAVVGLLVLVIVLPPTVIRASRPDIGAASAPEQLKAENDLRSTLVTTFGGLAVAAGTVVAALNFANSRAALEETQRQNRDQLKLSRRGQYTEGFSKAIEQLGHEGDGKLDVRIGAIYALEQIARDSGDLHWPIMEVLTTHLRHFKTTRQPAHGTEESTTQQPEPAGLPAEAQAIATVIGRRRHERDPPNKRLDLHEVNLSDVVWEEAHLEKANLAGAHLERANLNGAYLEETSLYRAHLEEASLYVAQLEGADLRGTDLKGADLKGTHLGGAQLEGADLSGAENLTREQLQRAAKGDPAKLPAYLIAP